MKAYSLDLRERIVAARSAGESVESIAKRFSVCTKTVRVYEKRAAQGQLPTSPRPGRIPRLSPEQHEALLALMQERTDWTLASLSQEWERRTRIVLPSSTLHDYLRRLKVSYKKSLALPANGAK